MGIEIKIKIDAYTIHEPTTFCRSDILKNFPIIKIDKDSYVVDSIIHTNLSKDCMIYNVQIGKHSSIARNTVFIVNLNHDFHSVSQGLITCLNGLANKSYKINRKGQILIENDCWIGRDVTIINGVIIHNGAVVAAESVVTKDVPPYAIVGGNPAKIIGYRFPEDIIHKLLHIQWWNWTDQKIIENAEWFAKDIKSFTDQFYNETKSEKVTMNRLTSGKMYLFFSDLIEPYSILENVIREFAVIFDNTDNELCIYINPNTGYFDKEVEIINQILEKYEEYNCYINLYGEIMDDFNCLFSNADYYISNRMYENLKYVELAALNNVKCISGVDSPIFTS